MRELVTAIFLLIFLTGCMSDTQAETLFGYEGTLIGNNSDVMAIVKSIKNGESVEKIELHTKEKPYGLTIHYDGSPDGEIEAWTQENAVKLLTLIDNAETVEIFIESEVYSYSKDNLEKEYGKKLDDIENEKEWEGKKEWIN